MSHSTSSDGYCLGANVGSTFTDVYTFTPDGQVARTTVPTTVDDRSIGIQDGIRKVQLKKSCPEETGLKPPRPQWDVDLYRPHAAIPYVQEWFGKMKEVKGWDLMSIC
ncbi:hypothetical protein BJX63DRAFT_436539 [Aspergillus granulosus]|uniref:Hydantoinase/oxoprolinase N-terminal domain-containing protein n=1 Tax=Aspergillus granulosus TaxID=176169 RepID=A0ABR4GYA3_9EURO